MISRHFVIISLLISFILGLYSCNSTKFVSEGEYLLDKVNIESDIPGYKKMELKPYLKQQPNYKMFGLNKTMYQIYNWAGKDSTKWINRFLKKIGEEPVIFDSTLVHKSTSEFKKLLVNAGYIHAEVSSEISYKNKKAVVVYRVTGNTPYRIRFYSTSIEDPQIDKELYGGANREPLLRISGETSSLRVSRVKEGMLFDRNLLDAERDRLTTLLRNRGYFRFTKEDIIYDADSSLNANKVDLKLKLRALQKTTTGDSTISSLNKFYLDKIFFYLDYDPLKITNPNDYPKQDSIVFKNYTVYYYGSKPSLRARTLLNNCFITPGSQYSQLKEDFTYSSFSSLRALNNIHIQFSEKTRNDSTLLDAQMLMMPARKQAISLSVEGTNTAGDLGVAASGNYMHKNLFWGAETFNFRVRGAYETISFADSYMELGGEVSLHFPKFILPFIKNSFLQKMQTSTEVSLSYNYQTRPEYDRTLLSGEIRYQWKERSKLAARHQLDLLNIDYVYLPRIDSLFINRLPTSAKYFGYTDQFIVGARYAFFHSTVDPMQKQKNTHSFHISLETAGNLLLGLSSLFGWKNDEFGSYQLFKTYFAQFVKGDFDYAKTLVFDKQNSIAWRISIGAGFPYGNSEMLPFEKRYYSGGANSVRAWSVRELGPGSYVPNLSTTFFNQSGDIKLDLNVEYRTRFFWKLEAAVFIDAGNIWTIKNYEGQEGGVFRFNSFYKEIAMGYGLGLRLDFDYFLIRFDSGMKAYDPARKGREKWTILHPNFKDNYAWHIAVGYPF
jgi:hypothetical protein